MTFSIESSLYEVKQGRKHGRYETKYCDYYVNDLLLDVKSVILQPWNLAQVLFKITSIFERATRSLFQSRKNMMRPNWDTNPKYWSDKNISFKRIFFWKNDEVYSNSFGNICQVSCWNRRYRLKLGLLKWLLRFGLTNRFWNLNREIWLD
jgi:hypothetical protein